VVQQGDTLLQIASQYGVCVADLTSWNELESDLIRVGRKLLVSPPAPTDNGPAGTPPPSKKEPDPIPQPENKKQAGKPDSKSGPFYVFLDKTMDAIDRTAAPKRAWKYIVVHHSGTQTGNARIFDYYHRKIRGMENGMAYHFVIGNGSKSSDGEIEVGERWTFQQPGGHLRSDEQNEAAIGICLVGNFNKHKPSKKQVAALLELVSYLRRGHERNRPKLYLHRDINVQPTQCPGRYFPAEAMYKIFNGGNVPKRPSP
jgi:hypothetical protein